MKELILHHRRGEGEEPARISVGYRQNAGAQVRAHETTFTFTLEETERKEIQWYLEEYLLSPYGPFRDRAARIEELIERKGTELFDAVFTDPTINRLYASVVNDLRNTRIVVHADSAEGVSLPWELMRDSQRGALGDLARRAYAFVRSQPDLFFEYPEPREGEIFNILMIICRPGGPEGDVPFQSVARPLLELFRKHPDRVNLHILRPPTLEQLARALEERPGFYHVVHFDGHGVFPGAAGLTGAAARLFYKQSGEQGKLLFEREDGTDRLVSGEELGAVLADRGIPAVLLNACQSGMTHPDAVYSSVGNQLLQTGVCGVVAMAYSVYVSTAVRFMARLYEGLINGEDLGRAVTVAREDLCAQSERQSPAGPVTLQDWVVPVLFEANQTNLIAKPTQKLHLRADVLEEKQAEAGTEIGCPPPPDFGFIGRDGVMLDLERAFQRETIVLLEGMAGVGKTETAMGFARWRAETGALGGPVFFFSFERYLTLATVCDRVGTTFQPLLKAQFGIEWEHLKPEQRRELAVDILKQIPCFLIFDNFEPLAGFPTGTKSDWTAEEQEELRDFLRDLRGGATKVLITSRRNEGWLGQIYQRVPLRGLVLREAQELAVLVLRRAGIDPKKIPSYNDLLRYLGGNPLAIQVILPELANQKPDALLTALQTGTATMKGQDAAQGRSHSLAASLNYRLDHLDPMLRQRIAVLGLFQGFVDANVLAALSGAEAAPEPLHGLDRAAWIKILDAASEVGLLRRVGEGYYSVHPALPWFLHDLLGETFGYQLEALMLLYCDVYSAYGSFLFDLAKKQTQFAMSLLSAEEANLSYALHQALQLQALNQVRGVLTALDLLLTRQSRWVEWERQIADLEKLVNDSEGEPIAGQEDVWRALLGYRQGIAHNQRDFALQEKISLRLRDYYNQAGDETNESVALHCLGMIAQEHRHFEEAECWYRESLEIKRRIGDEYGAATTLYQLGIVAEERGQREEAMAFYQHAEALVIPLSDPYHLSMVQEALRRVRGEPEPSA